MPISSPVEVDAPSSAGAPGRVSIATLAHRLPPSGYTARMFSWVRLFMLWAVMLAVPFQGYAAATMAFCASGDLPASQVRVLPAAHGAPDAAVVHDHGHADPTPSAQAHDPHDPHVHAGDEDASHQCGTCGACHASALTTSLHLPTLFTLPQADLQEPVHVARNVEPRLLDKPPRA